MWSVACVCRLCPENVSNGPFLALPLVCPPTRVTSTEAPPLTRCGLEPSQGIRLREQSPPSLADSGLPAAGHWPAARLLTWPTRLEQCLPAPDRLPAPLQRKVQPLPPNAVKGHTEMPPPPGTWARCPQGTSWRSWSLFSTLFLPHKVGYTLRAKVVACCSEGTHPATSKAPPPGR